VKILDRLKLQLHHLFVAVLYLMGMLTVLFIVFFSIATYNCHMNGWHPTNYTILGRLRVTDPCWHPTIYIPNRPITKEIEP